MPDARLLAPSSWFRLPRRTARLRLTALYSGLFLLSGAALVAITYALFERATTYKNPRLPKIPHTTAVSNLQALLPPPYGNQVVKAKSPLQLSLAQQGISQVQHELATTPSGQSVIGLNGPLEQIRNQLEKIQDQLTQGQNQLTGAEHQLAQIGPAQAAQRAVDSHQLLVNSGIALAIVAVLALLLGWFTAGRMLRPIRTITSTARRISSTSLHERLALDGPQDELKELGDTLDALFGRLDAAFDAQRHFVANASHELRTPLTAERTLLQVALDDPATTAEAWRTTAQEVLASSEEQARLIEALLTLASSESGLTDPEPVDLALAVTSALSSLQPEINRSGIHVDQTTAPAFVEGDPVLIARLAANLLANAVLHNEVGGTVGVATQVEREHAVLTVTNSGPLIPSVEVDRLFQPFQRLDPRRAHYKDGHGLGLSIVRAIASAHHAELIATARSEGGLAVSIVFPTAGGTDDDLAASSRRDGP